MSKDLTEKVWLTKAGFEQNSTASWQDQRQYGWMNSVSPWPVSLVASEGSTIFKVWRLDVNSCMEFGPKVTLKGSMTSNLPITKSLCYFP